MRISDWSSDVCSSDLIAAFRLELGDKMMRIQEGPVAKHDHMFTIIGDGIGFGGVDDHRPIMALLFLQAGMAVIPIGAALQQRKRSEERRVGKECGSTCSSRWAP